MAGERLPMLAILGGVFIVVGVLVSELKLKKKAAPLTAPETTVEPES